MAHHLGSAERARPGQSIAAAAFISGNNQRRTDHEDPCACRDRIAGRVSARSPFHNELGRFVCIPLNTIGALSKVGKDHVVWTTLRGFDFLHRRLDVFLVRQRHGQVTKYHAIGAVDLSVNLPLQPAALPAFKTKLGIPPTWLGEINHGSFWAGAVRPNGLLTAATRVRLLWIKRQHQSNCKRESHGPSPLPVTSSKRFSDFKAGAIETSLETELKAELATLKRA